MKKVLQEWRVAAMFFDVLLKFGNQPQVFEESSGFKQACQQPNGSFELSYQLMYVEPSGRELPRDQWSFRQTGVYHRYCRDGDTSQVVLLHPRNRSLAQGRLEGYAQSMDRHTLDGHPMNLHLVIISSYIIHWQDHNETLAKELESIRTRILVVDPRESQFEPGKLQMLRNIEDKIVCRACRCLKSTRRIVDTLIELNKSLPHEDAAFASKCISVHHQLVLFDHRLEGHINAADTLAQRVQATLGLLTNMLDLQNQSNSDKISTHMLHLTRESVDDNATVRFITVCTMIYLPASFMASFFGMNLFEYRSDSGWLRASPNFWVYVAATLPLTVLTVGGWYAFKIRHDKIRKKRQDEELLSIQSNQ
ncbi:hypothetical protein K469DRAFT_636798 [Zopfia rhizophila CBS 207.26]|uniref:Mg2+ transporter protein n=1 Tax=Zopfia rhizophila CBS 207.26 TaxID=1314779 RepID=A0A6A6DW36_9PEZI|nr:hypothetical protein K469DRAFT_636798 [Zopfia rhizophila CBS 207.26]